jgi:hypothetical protein
MEKRTMKYFTSEFAVQMYDEGVRPFTGSLITTGPPVIDVCGFDELLATIIPIQIRSVSGERYPVNDDTTISQDTCNQMFDRDIIDGQLIITSNGYHLDMGTFDEGLRIALYSTAKRDDSPWVTVKAAMIRYVDHGPGHALIAVTYRNETRRCWIEDGGNVILDSPELETIVPSNAGDWVGRQVRVYIDHGDLKTMTVTRMRMYLTEES